MNPNFVTPFRQFFFSRLSILVLLTFLISMPSGPSLAQDEEALPGDETARDDYEEESGEDEYGDELPEDFTGTLDDEEDEENPEFQRKKAERDAFGDRAADRQRGREDQDLPPEDDAPAYVLKFNFDSQVVFSDKKTGTSYMEINYNTKIEQEIALVHKRWRSKGEATFTSDISGNLAGNDLFTCKLDITIDSYPVNIMTRLKTVPETDEDPETDQVAVQIVLKNTYKESWFSNCTGVDGSIFNTQGSPEKYNLTILDNISPNLNGIVIEDFDSSRGAEVELLTEAIDLDDEDMDEVITLTGSGTLSIDYVGASE